MEHEQIERINFLAKKKKSQGLSKLELEEQAALRSKYLIEFRQGMKNTLDNVSIKEKDGSIHPLKQSK